MPNPELSAERLDLIRKRADRAGYDRAEDYWADNYALDVARLLAALPDWWTRGAEAMREAAAVLASHGGPDAPWNGRDEQELKNIQFTADRIAAAIRALPLPEPPEGAR